jgi:hypothetical protein
MCPHVSFAIIFEFYIYIINVNKEKIQFTKCNVLVVCVGRSTVLPLQRLDAGELESFLCYLI